jgi:tetrahydromethanopterin S-methyltransferase subunit G
MSEKAPTKTEILGVVEAQSDTLQELSERLVKMEKLSERLSNIENLTTKQETRNQNVLYIVLFGLVFIVVTVAVTVILTNKDNESISTMTANKIHDTENKNLDKITDIQNQINLLRAKNPYLK